MPVSTDVMTPEQREKFEAGKQKLIMELKAAEQLGVSLERFREIKAYAAKLHRKYPKWKAERIKRKTAAYFRIKLT